LEGISRYLGFIAFSLLLLLTFLCLGALASVISSSRARALGTALAMWFVFVLFYDLVALGVALLVNPHLSHTVILVSLFGNPVDLARVSGLLMLGGATIFGAAGASLVRTFGSPALAVVLMSSVTLLWSVVVLAVAGHFLGRREI
jgi:Cu-processing system permease protein